MEQKKPEKQVVIKEAVIKAEMEPALVQTANSAVEEKPPEIIAPVEEIKEAEPIKENSIIDFSGKDDSFAGLIEKKLRGKSYGFYPDDEVVTAPEKLAKQKKSNKSKGLNTLLRNILLK